MIKSVNGSLPKAVIFDLDDTLLDRTATFAKYIPAFAERYQQHLEPCDIEQLRDAILQADGAGYRPREQMAQMLLSTLKWKIAPEESSLVESYREDFLACACAARGMMEVISAIRSHGIKIGIITNGLSAVQRRKITRLGLDTIADAIVVSEEVGVKKPARPIYDAAMKQLSVQPDHCWFVGDHPENDIAMPLSMGMRAFWIRGLVDWPVDRDRCGETIEGLTDLLEHLEESR